MAVIPRPVYPGSSLDRGYTGYEMYDTEPELLRIKGRQDQSLLQSQLENQLRLAGIDAGTARRGQDVTAAANQLAADTARRGQDVSLQASLAPTNFARERFNTVFPWAQGAIGGLAAGGGDRVGGAPRALPGVTTGGVWSDEQVNQQVNSQKAGIQQQAAARQQQAAQQVAGRGFGRKSPLLAGLETSIGNQAMAAGADAERQTRWDAAQGNAQQRTTGETLAQQQWKDYEDSDIRRRQVSGNNTAALLSALSGFL